MADRVAMGLPRLVRGSVVTHRRRCGKPNCRCADGEALHESTVLSYSEGGRSRLLTLSADQVAAREVFRQLFADYLELRARDEPRLSLVVDAQGTAHGTVEVGHTRPLMTVFGEVVVRRIAYRKRGRSNLYPADAGLNLPTEKQSHGLRKLAAVESSRGSFDE